MSRTVACGCGYVVEGSDEADLLAAAERHIRTAHADAMSLLATTSLGKLCGALAALEARVALLESLERSQGGISS